MKIQHIRITMYQNSDILEYQCDGNSDNMEIQALWNSDAMEILT